MLGGSRRKLALLWALYFVQGMPYGFQATALPAYLRDAGMSLTGIGLASALSLPWMLKIVWAPLVDRYSLPGVGRRRSWILPLQLVLATTCAAAALVPPDRSLGLLLALVLGMNLWAATLDVAVDGLAVDLLEPSELGKGNIAQVVGFKVGMLTGGGLLVWASATVGWRGLFLGMAGLALAVFLGTLAFRERDALAAASRTAATAARLSLRGIVQLLGRALAQPASAWLVVFIGTYKLGESLADAMFAPFLIDAGFVPEQIGLWLGTWGMLFSIGGSVGGGLLASRVRLLQAVAITATLRVAPLAGIWWLSLGTPTEAGVVAVTCAEHFFGGALTTALFAYMMSKVDRRIGATHYTFLATIEVWGKAPARMASGAIAEHGSYELLFGLAVFLSAIFLILLAPLSEHRGRVLGDAPGGDEAAR
ncbi:MAG: MFS transporter [Thermoanaerobaculia bacterium]|nr:MFS transporter [Thermoanaerobaculia bacterium]